MNAPQDHDRRLLATGGAAAKIIRRKVQLLERFKEQVRAALPGAARVAEPIIVDTLPAFITRLALALAPGSRLDFASEYSNIALQHGNERAKLTGYSLSEVIREYQILRELLVSVLAEDEPLSADEWRIIHRSFDEAMGEAAAAFVEVQSRFRDVFTAALSHDFRGPLQNAINYLELIRRDADPDQRTYFAARAVSNLRRVDEMISQLLDVTRAHAGAQLTLRIVPCEAGRLARELVADLVVRHGDRFVLDVAADTRGHWDCDRLRQAMENVLTNAVKYGRPGTPITVRVAQTEGRLFVSVHNEGDPIPEHELKSLFLPFRRASSAERSRSEGWGLGLALVQAIAEAHGGTVSVESTPADGTTFTIDILLDTRALDPR